MCKHKFSLNAMFQNSRNNFALYDLFRVNVDTRENKHSLSLLSRECVCAVLFIFFFRFGGLFIGGSCVCACFLFIVARLIFRLWVVWVTSCQMFRRFCFLSIVLLYKGFFEIRLFLIAFYSIHWTLLIFLFVFCFRWVCESTFYFTWIFSSTHFKEKTLSVSLIIFSL